MNCLNALLMEYALSSYSISPARVLLSVVTAGDMNPKVKGYCITPLERMVCVLSVPVLQGLVGLHKLSTEAQ